MTAAKRSAFDKTRDQIAAENPHPKGFTPDLMCTAHGCPNRWSSGVGNLCTAHYAASDDKHRWPEITQQQQWDETERARMRGEPQPLALLPLTMREKRDILLRAGDVFERKRADPNFDPKAWAKKLEAKAARGQRLTAGQKHCLEQMRSPAPMREDEENAS